MSEARRNLVQIVVLIVLLILVIVALILIYIFRYNLFGPTNLSQYGSYDVTETSPCVVEGIAVQNVRCTDIGTQITVTKCTPNPSTGFLCFANNQQTNESMVSVSSCVPTCTSFAWDELTISPCLVDIGDVIVSDLPFPPSIISTYNDGTSNWCNSSTNGVRFRTYQCNTIDGSGVNTCTHLCDGSTFNADCFQGSVLTTSSNNGTTLLYNPIIVPTNSTIDLIDGGDGNYVYTPITKASVAFPVIASNVRVTREACTDLGGVVCGNWINSIIVDGVPVPNPIPNNNFDLTANCSIMANIAAASAIGYEGGTEPYDYDALTINTIYDMFEPGIVETILTCFAQDGTPNGRCNPNPTGCITEDNIFATSSSGTNNILQVVLTGPGNPTPICGLSTTDQFGNVTSIIKGVSNLNACIFANPNFSLFPNMNLTPSQSTPAISEGIFLFDTNAYIFGVPLFASGMIGTRSVYITLMNSPCPDYIITQVGTAFQFTFTGQGSFLSPGVDPIPPSGIPFLFDCKGNPYSYLENNPCAWIEDIQVDPATIWGLDPNCNIRTNNISPIIEQTALMLMIRPAQLDPTESPAINIIKCNIFAIFSSNYMGWLSWQNTIDGYQNGNTGANVLTWVQGRFDPYGNAITTYGTLISDIPNSNFYLVRNLSVDYQYTLCADILGTVPIQIYDGVNETISPMGPIQFQAATSQGIPLITTTGSGSGAMNTLNDTVFSNFLYSRQNIGTNNQFPACNAILQKVQIF